MVASLQMNCSTLQTKCCETSVHLTTFLPHRIDRLQLLPANKCANAPGLGLSFHNLDTNTTQHNKTKKPKNPQVFSPGNLSDLSSWHSAARFPEVDLFQRHIIQSSRQAIRRILRAILLQSTNSKGGSAGSRLLQSAGPAQVSKSEAKAREKTLTFGTTVGSSTNPPADTSREDLASKP